jgi:hypothetical protein
MLLTSLWPTEWMMRVYGTRWRFTSNKGADDDKYTVAVVFSFMTCLQCNLWLWAGIIKDKCDWSPNPVPGDDYGHGWYITRDHRPEVRKTMRTQYINSSVREAVWSSDRPVGTARSLLSTSSGDYKACKEDHVVAWAPSLLSTSSLDYRACKEDHAISWAWHLASFLHPLVDYRACREDHAVSWAPSLLSTSSNLLWVKLYVSFDRQ